MSGPSPAKRPRTGSVSDTQPKDTPVAEVVGDGGAGGAGAGPAKVDQLERFSSMRMRQIFKENHLVTICGLETCPTPGCDNLLASVAPQQVNIYDNAHCGANLDLMCQYRHEGGALLVCEWVLASSSLDAFLAFGGAEGIVYAFSLARRAVIHKLEGHTSPVTALCRHPSLPRVYSLAAGEGIRAWDVDSGTCLGSWENKAASAIAVHPGGGALYLGNRDGSIDSLSLAADAADATLQHHVPKPKPSAEIDCVRLCRKGSVLIAKSRTGRVSFFDADTFEKTHSARVDYSTDDPPSRFCVTSDDKLAIVGNDEGILSMFSVDTGAEMQQLQMSRIRGAVRSVVVAKDASSVVFAAGPLLWRWDYVSPEDLADEGSDITL